jgi:AcrR family transcriptional regulator
VTVIASRGETATRARILQGTARAIVNKGISPTTVQDILGAARLSRRTFYQNIDSKDDALCALFEILTDAVLDAIRTAATSTDPVERMLEGAGAYLGLWQTDPRLSLLLQTESMRSDSPLAPVRRRFLDTLCGDSVSADEQAHAHGVDPLVFRAMFLALEGLLSHSGEAPGITRERIRTVIEPLVRRTLAIDGPALPLAPSPELA